MNAEQFLRTKLQFGDPQCNSFEEQNLCPIEVIEAMQEYSDQQNKELREENDRLFKEKTNQSETIKQYVDVFKHYFGTDVYCDPDELNKEIETLKQKCEKMESLLIASGKYGYEYHASTSFPELSFEEMARQNLLQFLQSEGIDMQSLNKG